MWAIEYLNIIDTICFVFLFSCVFHVRFVAVVDVDVAVLLCFINKNKLNSQQQQQKLSYLFKKKYFFQQHSNSEKKYYSIYMIIILIDYYIYKYSLYLYCI